MHLWAELLIVVVLCLASVMVLGILLAGVIQRQTRMVIDAIQSMPTPSVTPETIIKYQPAPSEDARTPVQFSRTPESIVAEWAAQMEATGSPVSEQERRDQVELWSQNEEYL